MGADAPDDSTLRGPRRGESDVERLQWCERVRTALQEKTADDVARELPGLVDRLASVSSEVEDTRRFFVGVSLSRNDTLLDYSLSRVGGDATVETLKEPVSTDHRYLTFAYPPDPHFDAAALRGALLGTVEAHLRALTAKEDIPRIARLWDHLHGDG